VARIRSSRLVVIQLVLVMMPTLMSRPQSLIRVPVLVDHSCFV
jgi:hypothetical protein